MASSSSTAYVAPAVQQKAYVLCADCGTPVEPNGANLCINCLRNTVDITDGIPKQTTLSWCRGCERYLSPPSQWQTAALESRELLALCLRKLKGLSKVRLIDAGFIWTEPHSRRVRVKLTIQKEVLAGTIVQQVFEVEYVVMGAQCPECTRLAAKNTWRAIVQVRQKVDHKRTFLYLEQLILKHNADRDTLNVQEVKDGLNFFYASKQHALKMVDFLAGVAPVRSKVSEQLISQDTHTSTVNAKQTYAVEIAPICKDDVVCLPLKHARALGNLGQVVVCHRVGNQIYLIDPATLRMADVSPGHYWRAPFAPLADVTQAVEFVVLDIEPTSFPPQTARGGRFLLADAQVAPSSSSMSDDAIFHTRTHLGAVLKPGDTVLGYLFANSNFNSDVLETVSDARLPEVVLVRKTYPNRRKKGSRAQRAWKLRSIVKDVGDGEHTGLGRAHHQPQPHQSTGGRQGAYEAAKAEAEYERFLRDLEEDDEMRATVNLYKRRADERQAKDDDGGGMHDDSDNETQAATDDDDLPRIRMDELLDEMDDMTLDDEA